MIEIRLLDFVTFGSSEKRTLMIYNRLTIRFKLEKVDALKNNFLPKLICNKDDFFLLLGTFYI